MRLPGAPNARALQRPGEHPRAFLARHIWTSGACDWRTQSRRRANMSGDAWCAQCFETERCAPHRSYTLSESRLHEGDSDASIVYIWCRTRSIARPRTRVLESHTPGPIHALLDRLAPQEHPPTPYSIVSQPWCGVLFARVLGRTVARLLGEASYITLYYITMHCITLPNTSDA